MYKILDNFLPTDKFSELQDVFIRQNNLPWFFNPSVSGELTDGLNDFYFTHLFFGDNKIMSDYFFIFEDLIKLLEIKALIRIKANLYTKTEQIYQHPFHKDYNYSHKAAILYINSNNGKTILNESIKIDSVANRLLVFDPQIKHASTTCTDKQARINVNFNFF